MMRLFVFGAMIMALFVMSSCSETQEIEESIVEDVESLITSSIEGDMRMLIYDPERPELTDCFEVEGTCLNTVVVTPKNELLKQSLVYNSMIKYVEEERIEEFFAQKDWKNVFPMLDEKSVSNIVNGKVLVERTDYVKGGNIIIFKDHKDEVLLAIPFLHKAE